MAEDTAPECRNMVIYCVFVRNHGVHGSFADVTADLVRIRSIGVDMIWLLPIHPIGKQRRKGTLGSPYSISDYRGVNPEYGTIEDFRQLVRRAHELGLKVMIDVVFNHTAHDSVLAREHPEWFYRDQAGSPMCHMADWTDIVDLKHPNQSLSAYLIDVLLHWVRLGVDGFRCDVAAAVPVEFWRRAREEVAAVNPGVIWLGESVHAAFIERRRRAGLVAMADAELYQAFDLLYDYDIWPIWEAAVMGQKPPLRYVEMLRLQKAINPAGSVKMRCVENHDQSRIMDLAPTRERALAWTALACFSEGAFLIYAGQESGAKETPSLFERDRIEWGDYALQGFLAGLARLKKHAAQLHGGFHWLSADAAVQSTWYLPGRSLYGIFNVSGGGNDVAVRLADGRYVDVLSGESLHVKRGRTVLPASVGVVEYDGNIDLTPPYAPLLDFRPRHARPPSS